MLDYLAMNSIAAQDKDIVTILDELFQHCVERYPTFSRFSVALLGDKKASNYYVQDRLLSKQTSQQLDYVDHELRIDSALTGLAYNNSIRIVDNLSTMVQTERVSRLLSIGHRSSYTVPLNYRNKTLGFIFYNAATSSFFSNDNIQKDFAFLSNLVAHLFIHLHENQKHFQSALSIALNMGHA
ncbi:GAF domain-containing protein, partial [Vibrio vulnificus]